MPAAAWWPGKITPGQVCEIPCIGMDLFPTMAALGGANLVGVELEEDLLDEACELGVVPEETLDETLAEEGVLDKHVHQVDLQVHRHSSIQTVIVLYPAARVHQLVPSTQLVEPLEHELIVELLVQCGLGWELGGDLCVDDPALLLEEVVLELVDEPLLIILV